jgi:hypothetical protein
MDQAQAQLALANWALAVPTAKPATRWLMGFPATGDAAKLNDAVQLAETNLEKARALLKPEASEVKERRRTLRASVATLEAFAKFFAALAHCRPKTTCDPCGEAALGLAVARESENADIAAAALLWQSLGWELAGRRERALTSLPNALAAPDQLPYDFLSRLLRCRLLAEDGKKSAAIALAIRIQALCDKWFVRQEGPGLEEKRRLVAVLQYQFIREWIGQLDAGDKNIATKLEARLSDVRKHLVDEDSPLTVYYLETSIPILVQTPKSQLRSPATAEAATQPAKKRGDNSTPSRPTSQ